MTHDLNANIFTAKMNMIVRLQSMNTRVNTIINSQNGKLVQSSSYHVQLRKILDVVG